MPTVTNNAIYPESHSVLPFMAYAFPSDNTYSIRGTLF